MSQKSINTIADICAQHGIKKAIISPGSRNAPLTIAFNRHPTIKCFSISDERSAAFIALGMAQASEETVAIICTSGSAALNYAPAMAEAFFQQVPILILTADRPPEWIDQWDGQTIRQQNIYGRHVKQSYQLPNIGNHQNEASHAYRLVNEACLLTQEKAKGPVHLNIPFREPFYPEANAPWELDETARIVDQHLGSKILSEQIKKELIHAINESKQIAFLLGQENYDPSFLKHLNTISRDLNIPIFADVISNGHSLENAITLTDSASMRINEASKNILKPDLLISFGRSIISKNLKLFLRKSKINQWHISEANSFIADPFLAVNKLINTEASYFLGVMKECIPKDEHFLTEWKTLQATVSKLTQHYLSNTTKWNEFSALHKVIEAIPANSHIHLANSLSVRYVNFIGLKKPHQVWCNRGTSGIDGSNSTAMGHVIANSSETHFLITGDVAFFYDRNAFWHKYQYPNLRIVLINNQGGSIFRMIKGPKEQAELEEFFETKQDLTASLLCQEFNLNYFTAHNEETLTASIENLLKSEKATLLEIQSESKINQEIFELFKKHIEN